MKYLNAFLDHPLSKGRKPLVLCRYISFQLRTRLFGSDICFPWVNELRLVARRGMNGASVHYYTGVYDLREMAFFAHVLRKGELFLDLGANIGAYSILLAGCCGARTITVEAVPETADIIREQIALNGLEQLIHLVPCAVGEEAGSLRFTNAYGMANHVATDGEAVENVHEVPVRPAGEVLEGQMPIAIKLDVEGYEVPCLRSLRSALADDSCQVVVVELEGKGSRFGYDESEADQILKAAGFSEIHYDPLKRELRPAGERKPDNSNYIYLKDHRWVEARIAEAPALRVNGQKI